MKWMLFAGGFVILFALVVAALVHRKQVAGPGPLASAAPTPAARPPAAAVAMTPEHLDAFLAPHRDALAKTRRARHGVTLEEMTADEPLASKVGGQAWWPVGQPVANDGAGKPLVLLAQINFAELPPTPGYPRAGLVQFFISDDDYYGANFDGEINEAGLSQQKNFRVVYWPDLTVPAIALPIRRTLSLPHSPEKPRRMRFAAGDETLTTGDYRMDPLLGASVYTLAEDYAAKHGVSADDLMTAFTDAHGGSGHKVGGYPFFTQADPRSSGDWELLLQLDTDDGNGLMWGDSGVGGFFISPGDLARADFSRVVYNWDCY